MSCPCFNEFMYFFLLSHSQMTAGRPAMKRNFPHCRSTLPSARGPPCTHQLPHFRHYLSSSLAPSTISVSHLPQYVSIPVQKSFTFSVWNYFESCVIVCFDLTHPGVSCPKLNLPLRSRRNEKYGGNSSGLEWWAQGGQSLWETSLQWCTVWKRENEVKSVFRPG